MIKNLPQNADKIEIWGKTRKNSITVQGQCYLLKRFIIKYRQKKYQEILI